MHGARRPEQYERRAKICGAVAVTLTAAAAAARAGSAGGVLVWSPVILAVVFAALAAGGLLSAHRMKSREEVQVDFAALSPIADLRGQWMYDLGVETEAPQALLSLGHRPGTDTIYRWRSVDALLDERLESACAEDGAHLVVVSGPPKAGKTRTLIEAMARQGGGGWLVAPRTPEALMRLAASGAPNRSARWWAVWLDDIEPFVQRGAGLDAVTLRALAGWNVPVVVLAARGGKGTSSTAAATSELVSELVTRYPEVRLLRELDAQELERVRAGVPSEAADRIAEDGLGVFMIAAQRLLQRFEDDTDRVGHAVIAAAVDWQRIFPEQPVTDAQLRRLCAVYTGGAAADRDAFKAGLAWAMEPLYGDVALLSRARLGASGYVAYDYVVDAVDERQQPIPAAAWSYYREVVANDLDASLELGRRANAVGEGEIAEDIYRQLDAAGFAAGAYQLAGLMLKRDEPEEAERLLQRADEHGHALAATRLGVLHRQRDDLAGAELAWERGHARGEPASSCNLAWIRQQQGQGHLDEARSLWEVSLAGGHGHAALGLADLCEREGDVEGAVLALERGEAAGFIECAYRQGQLLRLSDRDRAKLAFARAEAEGHKEATWSLALILEEDGELEAALRVLRRGDARDEHEATNMLAVFTDQQGDREAALALYLRAKELGNPHAAHNLGIEAAAQSDVRAAEALYRVAIAGGCRHAYADLGGILERRGELLEARVQYELGDGRNDGDAALRLGKLLEKAGDLAAAEEAYVRAVDRKQAGADEALAAIRRDGPFA